MFSDQSQMISEHIQSYSLKPFGFVQMMARLTLTHSMALFQDSRVSNLRPVVLWFCFLVGLLFVLMYKVGCVMFLALYVPFGHV